MYACSIGCNSRPEFGTFLGNGSSDGAAFHLALVVDDYACIVLEVKSHSVFSVEWLPLSDYNRGNDLN